MSLETAKMSSRGQIIIPKDIRDQVGATANTVFTMIALDDGRIIMRKLDAEQIRKDLETFREIRRKTKKVPQAYVDRVIREVRAERRAKGRS